MAFPSPTIHLIAIWHFFVVALYCQGVIHVTGEHYHREAGKNASKRQFALFWPKENFDFLSRQNIFKSILYSTNLLVNK